MLRGAHETIEHRKLVSSVNKDLRIHSDFVKTILASRASISSAAWGFSFH
jgi:hypothetical protein